MTHNDEKTSSGAGMKLAKLGQTGRSREVVPQMTHNLTVRGATGEVPGGEVPSAGKSPRRRIPAPGGEADGSSQLDGLP